MRKFLVTGLGAGYAPIAPGTAGSAAVIAIYILLSWLDPGCFWSQSAVLAGIVILSSVICVSLGRFAEQTFGKKDPGQVTIDEWAGQALALVALPTALTWSNRLTVAITAFLLFRLFDILKPAPANRLQALPAGWGILVDDLIAGLYANIVAQLFLRLALHMN